MGLSTDIREVFAQRLAEWRNAHDVSQDQLAEKMVTSKSSISHYESGKRLPGIDVLDRLVRATGCSVKYFLGYIDSERDENADIARETTLTDKDIDIIQNIDHLDAFRFLIHHPEFENILRAIAALSTPEILTAINSEVVCYAKFRATDAMQQILFSAEEIGKETPLGVVRGARDMLLEAEREIEANNDDLQTNGVYFPLHSTAAEKRVIIYDEDEIPAIILENDQKTGLEQ